MLTLPIQLRFLSNLKNKLLGLQLGDPTYHGYPLCFMNRLWDPLGPLYPILIPLSLPIQLGSLWNFKLSLLGPIWMIYLILSIPYGLSVPSGILLELL